MSLARLVFFSLSSILYPCVSHDIPECNPTFNQFYNFQLVRKLLYEAADKIKEHNLLREQQGIYTLIEDTVYTWIVLWAEIKTNDYGVKYVSLPPLFKMVRKLVDTDNTIPQTYSLKRAAKIIADCMFLEGEFEFTETTNGNQQKDEFVTLPTFL
ncbi:hypothetical protein RF11_10956 [Thelohanellus kitauei]|uniref:Uncharacterized protein n=1 Tax=Thelohanellus kitauei TaxID=669202 RepID=A0A0C2IV63_THEKT|nr:hypothetical protein RF11_10956 [Thelohanellus kitauei]